MSASRTLRSLAFALLVANVLKQRADAIKRFMDAYRESYEFLYSDPRGVRIFSEYSKVPEALAIQIRDTFKTLAAPLSQQQLTDLIQIPPRP